MSVKPMPQRISIVCRGMGETCDANFGVQCLVCDQTVLLWLKMSKVDPPRPALMKNTFFFGKIGLGKSWKYFWFSKMSGWMDGWM
jgi:hypothetical protein